MKKKFKTFEALIIYGLYLLPILLWSLFSFSHMHTGSHWTLFAMGLLLAAFGTLAIQILTASKMVPEPVLPEIPAVALKPAPIVETPAPLPPPLPDPALLGEIESLKTQINSLKISHEQTLEEAQKNKALEQDKLKNLLEEETRASHQKDEQVLELKAKINELEYEIKALVDFNQEAESYDFPPLSESDASHILKKWLDAADTQSSLASFGKLIQAEPSALLFLYSLKESQALFANGHSLTLFGLPPEQFAAQFHTFLPKESLEWHQAVSKIANNKWAALPLNGAKAVMAPVTKGPLQGYTLGIVY